MAGTCIPPVCGGYRWCSQPSPAGWKYSPRMRGLSEVFDLIQKGTDVFPPHAGVIGHPHGYLLHSVSIPPACGGYRLREAKTPPRQGYSPRVRGLSVTFWQLVKHFCVFPPHAGVIGVCWRSLNIVSSIPPACGGYRAGFPSVGQLLLYSPRERGLSVPDSCFRQWIKVFPPHAGVIGTTRSEWTPVMSIPPACGGIDIKTAMVGLLLCAPTSRWDFLQSRKVTFFRITHILSNLAGCNQQRPYVDKFMP